MPDNTPQEQPDNPTPQPSLRSILDWYFWSLDKTKDENQTSINEAEQAILALIASAKSEKDNPELYDHHTPSYNQAIGYNQGIDAYEASLLRKLGGEG